MGALLLVCAAGASAPALIPSAQATGEDPATTDTVPTLTDTTPTGTTPTDTTPTGTTPTDTTPTGTTPTDTTPTQTSPPPDPPPPPPPADEQPPPAEEIPEQRPPDPPSAPAEETRRPAPGTSTSAPAPAPARQTTSSGSPAPGPATGTGTASGPAAPERCRHADSRLSVGHDKVEAALRCLVDAERWSYGLEPLAADPRLDVAARSHAADMAGRNFFGHVAPEPAPQGATVGDRVLRAGYEAAVWGENLAAGQRTAAEVMAAWMNSAGHREELLDGRFTQMGLGFAAGADGRVRWAQVFGRPAGEPEPVHPRLNVASRAASRTLTAAVERRGKRLVVRGGLGGAGKLERKIRITALRGTSIRSRTVSARPGARFAASVGRPARKGRIRVLVRVVGSSAQPLRLSIDL